MVVSAVGYFFSIITDWVACASSPTQSLGMTAPELWGYGYGMALGYAEGYQPGLDGQRI